MSSFQPSRRYEHVFAIVRVDDPSAEEAPLQERVTVKRIVWSQDEAESEVQRLNALNRDKGCTYFWQITRLDPRPAEVPRS